MSDLIGKYARPFKTYYMMGYPVIWLETPKVDEYKDGKYLIGEFHALEDGKRFGHGIWLERDEFEIVDEKDAWHLSDITSVSTLP